MESLLGPLLPLFERERAAGRALALGLLVQTVGSTYRKAGALMLIAANGDSVGLLSGGCLEGDLAEHARSVIETGQARLITYDMRGGDDLVWGLGLGCEGAMHILLLRTGPENDWQPLAHFSHALTEHRPTAAGIVVESDRADSPVGSVILGGSEVDVVLEAAAVTGRASWLETASPRWKMFALPLWLPPKLLLLGAGPDAAPVVELAAQMNWKVTLVDHRPAYADASHFPRAERVLHGQPDELATTVDLAQIAAAVVMSHHLPSDLKYLRSLAATTIPYIGLLGPAARRERLLTDLEGDAELIRARLHAPVGLPIGGRSPESIALSIIAEIHAFVHGREQVRGKPVSLQPIAVA